MLIRVRHETHYRYGAPVKFSVQYLRLTPESGPGQNVLAWKISAPGRLAAWRDHHGNLCHSVTLADEHEEIEVVASGEAETRDTGGILPCRPGELPTGAYLRQTPYTKPDQAVVGMAEARRAAMVRDRVAGLHELMAAISRAVAYQEGETGVETTAAEALAAGKGVCQDHAHLFLACCRHLGVPARYVSCYLAGRGGQAGSHGAGHAWAEALVGDLGWLSFDPANGIAADAHYMRLAVGLDYGEAAPLRGVRHGGDYEAMKVQIQIQGQD